MARPRALNYAEKRRSILIEAARLFAQHGYVGTSTSMIAHGCGVSKALLYHYYPDKETILFDLLHTHLEELVEIAESAFDRSKDKEDILYTMSSALLEAYLDADNTHHVQISSLSLLPSEKQETLRELERKLVSIFAKAVALAVPEIGEGPLLKPMTMSLFGMLNWHYLWFRDGKALTRDNYARLAATLISRGGPHVSKALGQEAAPGIKDAFPATRQPASKRRSTSVNV